MVSSKKTAEIKEEKRVDSPGTSRPRKSTKGKQRPTYRRRVKPPFSYAELITMAIKASPTGMVTLREILEHMSASYECFRGSYVGWKNSVRHNLSANECFVKVLRNVQRPYGKDNFWTLNTACLQCSPDARATEGTMPGGSMGGDEPSTRWKSSRSPASPSRSSPVSEELQTPCLTSLSGRPSPTPGLTPGMDAPSSGGQACDEWSHLEDLFVPDADIDLALYDDDLAVASNSIYQPFASDPSRLHLLGRTSSDLYPTGLIKAEYPSSYSPPPSGYSFYHPREGLFPNGISECGSAFLPYIRSPSPAAERPVTVVKSEPMTTYDWQTTASPETRTIEHGSRVSPGDYGQMFAGHRDEETTDWEQPHSHRLGSIVASAIRGSLGLDLEESALQAIDRSVELLGRRRLCDLACA